MSLQRKTPPPAKSGRGHQDHHRVNLGRTQRALRAARDSPYNSGLLRHRPRDAPIQPVCHQAHGRVVRKERARTVRVCSATCAATSSFARRVHICSSSFDSAACFSSAVRRRSRSCRRKEPRNVSPRGGGRARQQSERVPRNNIALSRDALAGRLDMTGIGHGLAYMRHKQTELRYSTIYETHDALAAYGFVQSTKLFRWG